MIVSNICGAKWKTYRLTSTPNALIQIMKSQRHIFSRLLLRIGETTFLVPSCRKERDQKAVAANCMCKVTGQQLQWTAKFIRFLPIKYCLQSFYPHPQNFMVDISLSHIQLCKLTWNKQLLLIISFSVGRDQLFMLRGFILQYKVPYEFNCEL